MLNSLETMLLFRAGENWTPPALVCGICGKEAEGDVQCDGDQICDACDKIGMGESE